MTNDLISRSALLAEYDRVHVGEPGGARKLIAEAKAVDAEPVRHGEWIDSTVCVGFYECSQCRTRKRGNQPFFNNVWNYCPNCGAKMDGGANHD